VGKWTWIREKLPKFQDPESGSEKFQKAKQEIESRNLSLGDLVELYRELRDEKDALEDKVKELNPSIGAAVLLINDKMEQQGITSVRMKDGGSVSEDIQPYVSLADSDAFIQWVYETNKQEMLTMHYQRMASLVKEYLEQGMPAPPGVNVYYKQGLRKVKGRG
jgi:hypothetical protein